MRQMKAGVSRVGSQRLGQLCGNTRHRRSTQQYAGLSESGGDFPSTLTCLFELEMRDRVSASLFDIP